ncbi:tRNA 2-thiocytidine(32) synthetase TtcA [Verticiella sediminum]|uniref:tRNA-cytidine(32) 2-sulfurtransferase n=1 Tax=Verticiella sediminum TaxID=1247510 RepID=A0A556AG91_9BURK|nr:tRNA 2-thiocytidine(32) synthetase TtcA [Verticiella sediminum]TSH91896.1 tRNA 2-thiocytidine(32) synthetase TtcA [Verticiella sediminum]
MTTAATAPQTEAHDTPNAIDERKLAFERNKLAKRLMRETGRAIADFNMIEDGDKVMVCLSGGKDSYGLLDILLRLRERAPIHFDIVAVNLDQKQPGFPEHVLPEYLDKLGVPYHIETQDTYSIVTRLIPEGKTMCSLCSRLRRGILYRVADELGATKIALGHHRDDILATFLMNLFYGGIMKAMPPKLVSDDGRHTVIRPLAYVREDDLVAYAAWREFPIIPCNLCGSQEGLKRQEAARLIDEWEARFPGRVDNMFNALGRVIPSHLMDHKLYDFVGLEPTGRADPDGDTAFDPVEPAGDRAAEPCDTPGEDEGLRTVQFVRQRPA